MGAAPLDPWMTHAGVARWGRRGSDARARCGALVLKRAAACSAALARVWTAPHGARPVPTRRLVDKPPTAAHTTPQAREKAALSQLKDLEDQAQAAQDESVWLRRQLQERDGELAAQRAVNTQLMAKKEDVEWWAPAGLAARGYYTND